ncbi:MAG: glycosyl transferase [Gemmataceae bacterium]|nr:glycosyl transferase [Gemmataceae bacterium]
MTLLTLASVSLGCAALPALLYLWNTWLFRPPPVLSLPGREAGSGTAGPAIPRISVLIPARNEERSIGACLDSVLASDGVEMEVVVLDDHSNDRTAAIVRELAAKDPRVRLEPAPPLPAGWCGKQHACFILSGHARFPVITFLDADVRLAPDGLARMAAFLRRSKAGLVSGFPRQETGTLLEKLVIPLIHWLLLGFLPMAGMRWTRRAAFAVGCGQWFMTTRAAYEQVGGHAAVKASLHDGLSLPRAYRRAGLSTDICDATDLAVCRMYRSASEVWFGLAKNAREGMAATSQIGFWTVILLCGQVLPLILLLCPLLVWVGGLPAVLAAIALIYVVRAHVAIRFRQSALGELLHPIGVLILIGIQWYAIYRAVAGRPVGWKGRTHPANT